MPLENASFINELVPTNPAASDGLSQGDDHIRMIKAVLQSHFPNFAGVAVTATEAQINSLVGGSTLLADGADGTPSLAFSNAPDTGLYLVDAATDEFGISGRLLGNGAKEPGELCLFPFVPATMASGGSATGAELYLECDGSTYANALFPRVATALNQGGSNFTVPNLKGTGRFLRSRTNSVAVGTSQSNQNASHTHTVSASGTTSSDGAHTHTYSDPGHVHGEEGISTGEVQTGTGATGGVEASNNTSSQTTGITINAVSAHSHTVTVTGTAAADGGSEARPEAYSVVMALKT
jgi:hypothetical protein